MKKLLAITLILTLAACNKQDYKIETKAFECLASSYKMEGFDIKKELLQFENYLIETGILKDNSGNSYYDIYHQIDLYYNANFLFDYSFLDSIMLHSEFLNHEKIRAENLRCFDIDTNSKAFKKSKLYVLSFALDSVLELQTDFIDLSSMAKTVTRILSPKDFEQDYYKMTALFFLASLQQDKASDSLRKLPPVAKNKKGYIEINERNLLRLELTEDTNFVYFNKSKIAIDDLAIAIKESILNEKSDSKKPALELVNIENIGDCYKSKYVIALSYNKDVKYKTFNTVQNQIFKAIHSARNEMAIKYFKKEYDKLDDFEKKAINELVPRRISNFEK